MKKVIVIAKYEAYIPDDMSIDEIENSIEKEIRDRGDFRILAENYHNESESEPLFEISDVNVCTNLIMSINREDY
jgi:uncharacterized protein YeeX (DUF496 family)